VSQTYISFTHQYLHRSLFHKLWLRLKCIEGGIVRTELGGHVTERALELGETLLLLLLVRFGSVYGTFAGARALEHHHNAGKLTDHSLHAYT